MGEFENTRANRLAQMLGKEHGSNEDLSWPEKPIEMNGPQVDSALNDYPLVVLDFWATRCQPCKIMEPVMNALAKDNHGKVLFGKVNMDENIKLAGEYGIRSLPTFCIFKDTELVDKAEGILTKDKFQSMLKSYL